MGPTFALQTLPAAMLGVAGTIAGLSAGRALPEPEFLAIALTAGLVCFAAAHAFPGHRGWVALFIAGVSFAAGVALSRLPSMADPGTTRVAAAAAILSLGVAAVAGRALPSGLAPLYLPLWIAAWALILVVVGAQVMGVAESSAIALAGTSIMVFTCLAGSWFARLPAGPRPILALDLYLLGLNLFLSAGILQTASA